MEDRFVWQHISFADGSNPYICTCKENFTWMNRHYEMVKIKENFWLATGRR